MTNRRAILIAGPTASGKSAMALELAATHNGIILNADSMQVYHDLRVISARPSDEDQAKAPHRLYGFVSAEKRYSVGSWIEDIAREIRNAEAEGFLPIIVGGTGLYFKALLEGLVQIPPLPDEVTLKWRKRGHEEGPKELYKLLVERDPEMAARLKPNDGQRIVRSLTVLEATGRSLLEWQKDDPVDPVLTLDACDTVYFDADREWLYARINARFDTMIANGGMDEVIALEARSLDPMLPAMKALGVPRLLANIRGELSIEEAIIGAKTDTRRYAKRQKTWFRTQMAGWHRHIVGDEP